MSVPTLEDVKPRLNIPSGEAVNDDELQSMLDAAVDHYERYVGSLEQLSVTEEYDIPRSGGPIILRKCPVASVTSLLDSSGAAVSYRLEGEAGLLYPARNTYWPSGYVTVTYVAGFDLIPADIVETIVLDVAGLYASTQRGGGGRQFGTYTDAPDAAQGAYPITLFPRIDALRKTWVTIA